jgi:hypothetical protein
MRCRGLWGLVLVGAFSVGCEDPRPSGTPDGGSTDAATIDGAPGAGRSAREVVSGSGRLTSGSVTLDLQIGHPVGQQPATSGTATVQGAAAVQP